MDKRLVDILNILLLIRLVHGSTDYNINGNSDEDIPTETSSDNSKILVQNTFHLSKVDFEKLPNIEVLDERGQKDELSHWKKRFHNWEQIVEGKLHSLVKSNENLYKKLNGFEEHFIRIVNAIDQLNQKLIAKNSRHSDGTEIMKKLNLIQRHIANSSNKKCPDIIGAVQIEIIKKLVDAITSASKHLEGFSSKELRMLLEMSKKSTNPLKDMTKDVVANQWPATKPHYDDADQWTATIPHHGDKGQWSHKSAANQWTSNPHNVDERSIPLCDMSRCNCKPNEQNQNSHDAFAGSLDSPLKAISQSAEKKAVSKMRSEPYGHGETRSGIKDRVMYEPHKYNCHDLLQRKNGLYKFASMDETPNEAGRYFYERYCDFNTDGVAWTVIQRRYINKNQENFNRSWAEYKLGFGELDHEFWYGNDFIHQLTFDDDMELRIVLEDLNGREEWAEYSMFRVEAEEYNYNLMIGGYKGSIPDSFLYHNDQDFSTYDRQNDNSYSRPCALSYGSGWWFNNCTEANLNGFSRNPSHTRGEAMGKIWKAWLGSSSVKSSKMMIRPKDL